MHHKICSPDEKNKQTTFKCGSNKMLAMSDTVDRTAMNHHNHSKLTTNHQCIPKTKQTGSTVAHLYSLIQVNRLMHSLESSLSSRTNFSSYKLKNSTKNCRQKYQRQLTSLSVNIPQNENPLSTQNNFLKINKVQELVLMAWIKCMRPEVHKG